MSARFEIAAWRRALVYGLGSSGLAAARLLVSRGIEVVAVDRRALSAAERGDLAADPRLDWLLGRDPEEPPAGIDGVVVSPGVSLAAPFFAAARARGVPIVAEVEAAWQLLEGDVVGVTGSNGKTTTTALTGALLEGCGAAVEVCGNIGTPLSAVVDGPPGRLFVVELSSFQLEAIASLAPCAAAYLNLSPDHLDRHGSLAVYGAAKRRIFEFQGEDDVAVLNADDADPAATWPRARRRAFSRRGPVEDGLYLDGESVVEVAPGEAARELFRVDDVPLAGVHNLENAMAAALLARACGAAAAPLRAALRRFRGLPHRLERVAEVDGVAFFDDSKGTNVAATERSLEGFADRSVHLILGGRNKGADPAYLLPMVARKAKRIYLIGEAAGAFAGALAGAVPAERSETLERAVAAAASAARRGEAVVLSPACASFDQFRDYAHRGEEFQRLVRELTAEAERG